MAHLTKPVKYDIKDSNIALLGSDLEKRVREHAGDVESAWRGAGQAPGLEVWRVEKFAIVQWPAKSLGSFYDGDSYIVLHTYKKDPKSETLSYDLHFWLGENTTQDEAGTAAYKTVELDDHLHCLPVQYREVQGYESARFLSYFPHFLCLRGGVATGFHHVSVPPPLNVRKLYRISLSRDGGHSTLVIYEVQAQGSSLVKGDVFVLDKGTQVWQFNTKASQGQEKYKAAEFVRKLVDGRKGQCTLEVFDEGSRAGRFLAEFELVTLPSEAHPVSVQPKSKKSLYRLSDSSGTLTFDPVVPLARSTLSSDDVFLLDAASSSIPAIYIWIGKASSHLERRMAVQYAQTYLQKKHTSADALSTTLVKILEGEETAAFNKAIDGDT